MGIDKASPKAETGPAYQEAITINADTGIPLEIASGPAGKVTYQAIRALICHAAAGTDPGRLSFTTALHAARRTLASPAATLASAGTEILASPLPGRPPRTCARALADPTRPYPARNGKPQPLPQAARYALTITPPGTTTRQHHDQQQHATSQTATSP